MVVIEAYGSYGISNLADFSARRAAFMKEGIAYGICHVRGGGELGEAWRLAGKDANKHNTWQDVIACGEDLIARGITTKSKLFIIGGSAGGITMGRAMEERPDLFAGVLDMVPAANTLRAEFSPNGPNNIPEFGTVTKEQGFKNLYDMDSIQHIQKGATYPGDHDLDRPQRSARLAVGAGQVRGGAAGRGLVQPGAAAHRCAGRSRHRLDPHADRRADGRRHRLRQVALRRSRLASGHGQEVDAR